MKNSKSLFAVLFFLSTFGLNAQNPVTMLAPKFKDGSGNFQNLPNQGQFGQEVYDGQPARYSQNMQVDKTGKILFFVVDGFIYGRFGDKLGNLEMGNFVNNGISYPTNQCLALSRGEVQIVPVPGNCHEYFIISATCAYNDNSAQPGASWATYGKIRIEYSINSLLLPSSGYYKYNNGTTTFTPFFIPEMNAVIPATGWMKPLPDMYSASFSSLTSTGHIMMATTRKNNNGERFVFFTENKSIWRYTLSAIGLTNGQEILNFSNYFQSSAVLQQFYPPAEMEVVTLPNGNHRVTTAVYVDNTAAHTNVLVFDVNTSGTVIAGTPKHFAYSPNNINTPIRIKGMEFSPLGNKLYVTHNVNPTFNSPIDVFDVSGTTMTIVGLSASGMNDFQFSDIETATDGSLILVTNNRMAKITNPSATWSNANWNNNFLPFQGFTYPLTNMNQSFTHNRYLLADQLDQDNYNTQFTETPECCVAFKTYDKAQFTATANGTWLPGLSNNPVATSASNTVFIKEELRIPAGRTIIIRNMIFRFAPGARVIIENGVGAGAGGRLILDNTTFTNDTTCSNQLWQGVEVWGNTNMTQQSTSQGRLVMMNNASIQNAHVGALLTKRTTPNAFWGDNNRNGGVVQAVNSAFINNNYGVYFAQYQSTGGPVNNISYFHNTRFEWNTSGRPTNSAPNTHAYLNRVRGVNFRGCAFNVSNLLFASNATSNTTGIYSLNSQFYVDEFCSVFTQGGSCSAPIVSTFLNLQFGARTSNFSQHSYSINKSIFTNCQFGIHTSSAKLPRITRNTFRVREIANAQSAGLVLNFSTGYVVQENTFEEFNNTAVTNGSGQSYGILVHNSDSLHNQIYRNTFQNLKIGGQTQARNGATHFNGNNPPSGGLQWKCNTFLKDIYTADLALANGSMDYDQGYLFSNTLQGAINAAANNKFSLWGEGTTPQDHDLNVTMSSNQHKYVYLANNLETPDNFTSLRVSAVPAQFMTVPVSSTANSCPTKLGKTFGDLSGILDDNAARKFVLTNQIVSARGAQLLALKNELAYTNSLISETRNEISSRMQLDTSEFASPVALDNFLTAQNNVESKLHLIYANIDGGILNNNTLVGTIANSISTNEKAFITILEELGSSINVADAISDPAMYTRIANIANSQNDVMTAAKAKALLIVVGETGDIEDFWPLDGVTSSQIFLSEEEEEQNNAANLLSASVQMFPNPTDGAVVFSSMSKEKLFTKIEVYDLSGMQVARDSFAETTTKSLNYNSLTSGIYVVKIFSDKTMVDTKLLNLK